MEKVEVVDFAKGVAIFAIIIFHGYEAMFGWPGHDLCSFLQGGLIQWYSFSFNNLTSIYMGLLKLTSLGYQGVSVFVVMAGFLAVWSTRSREFDPYRYLGRRLYRLFPLYWIALAGCTVFNILVYGKALASTLDIFSMYVGYYPIGTSAWVLNPSFWFITLIIQLYVFFPVLRGVHVRLNSVAFLFLMGILSFVSTHTLMYVSPLAGQFFGCWLLEFSFGMVIATKFERVDKILSRIVMLIPLALAYIVGFFLGSYPDAWPIARPLYGIALTLFIWTVYNAIRSRWGLKWVGKAFVFVGVNSYALYLINQPFIQDYFIFISSFTGEHLSFANPIQGSMYNLMTYPLDRYILLLLIYVMFVIIPAYVLTKVDNRIQRTLVTWSTKQRPTNEQAS
jgi:peptidoglycan/LPS O-acetylase OafA/YrhL